jgi:hypothetical protein
VRGVVLEVEVVLPVVDIGISTTDDTGDFTSVEGIDFSVGVLFPVQEESIRNESTRRESLIIKRKLCKNINYK